MPEPLHRNHGLFSDYYLANILPRHPEWGRLVAEAAPRMARLAALYAGYAPSPNEAQVEHELIRPAFDALGHTFEVQPTLRTPEGPKRPDYVLYHTAAGRAANKGKPLTDDLLRGTAFAVADAKHWDRPLDTVLKGGGKDGLTGNPAAQIAFYLRHSRVEWGILSNGRLWRLVHRDSAERLDRFYEVDLPALLAEGDAERFLFFSLFFGRDAFEPDVPHGAPTAAAMLRASADYARGVGEGLKTQVYEALRHLAQGFLDYSPNGLGTDPATLKQIYDNALIVLYRLLFILYAEARDLLPVASSPAYRDAYSLQLLKASVAEDLDRGRRLLPTSAMLWPRLATLCEIIDRGSPPLHVATYNGGLFDPVRHPFLQRYAVGDAHLQAAIDRLARVETQFVDYRDLQERHLGTIYEGLLEYQLVAIPPEAGWSVALLNDKGERKATGSYYTPDYVVKYLVDQTLGPVLRAAVAGQPDDAAKIAAVLQVNVVDPAMGSGHFLVEATEYIARFLVEQGVVPQGAAAAEPDIQYWKRRVAQSCIYGVDLNPLAVELAKLSLWLSTVARDRPLSFLDHHLRAGNALVGARIADLQVGSGGAGAQRRASKRGRVGAAAGQLSMLDDDAFRQSMSTAVDSMWLIEGSAGATVDQVKEQERIYAGLRETLTRRYGRLADLVTATHFGLSIDPSLWQPLADYATGRTLAALPRLAEWASTADTIAAERHFFHWELEFPEIFFDRLGQPLGAGAGFDAVVGNPPYVRQEELAPLKPYFASTFPDLYHGTADLFVYFFGQGIRLLAHDAKLAYISSNSWLRANYAGPLRASLRTAATVETLIDLGDNRVFADAPDVYPAILVVRRLPPPDEYVAQTATFTRGEGLAGFADRIAAKLAPVSVHDQADSGWQLGDNAGRRVLAKLMAGGIPLNEVVGGQMYRGVVTGANDVFIIDQSTRDRLIQADPSSASIIKLLLRGEDLRPWYQENEGRWLIFTRRGINIDAYPAVKAYLEQFRDRLEPRPGDWKGAAPWQGRKEGPYKWYEIQDSVDYYPAFDKPKIFWPELAKQPRFSWDATGTFVNNKGYIAPFEAPWLLRILNSRATWFAIMRTCLGLGERTGIERFQLFAQFITRLPIPDASAAEREAIGAVALAITEQARARYDLHRRTQQRILSDLGTPDRGLNQKLTAWWTLDFPAFRAEAHKVFRRDIPLADRDDWEALLTDRRAAHTRHTAEIVRLETDLNARVNALFDLTPDEIRIVEESTTYRYGEV